jgi:hypothetical protein
MIGGLSLPAKNSNFWSPALQWGNLIAIPEAFFVQLADAVSHLCKALHKLVEKSLQPRHCRKNHSQQYFDYEPSTLVRLYCYLRPFSLSTFVSPKATLRVYRAVGKYFPM